MICKPVCKTNPRKGKMHKVLTGIRGNIIPGFLYEFYLVFGKGQSEPYSWTCMPKKQTSTPSISSNAKSALVL